MFGTSSMEYKMPGADNPAIATNRWQCANWAAIRSIYCLQNGWYSDGAEIENALSWRPDDDSQKFKKKRLSRYMSENCCSVTKYVTEANIN